MTNMLPPVINGRDEYGIVLLDITEFADHSVKYTIPGMTLNLGLDEWIENYYINDVSDVPPTLPVPPQIPDTPGDDNFSL